MTFAIGESVGPYRIIAQLGSGGMATVYKAYHAALDRYVAIKVMHAAFKEAPNFLARFQREARIVAKLEHPHIVPVYDFNAAAQANGRLREAYLEPAEMLMNRSQPGDFLHAAQICEQGLRFEPSDAQLRTCAARAWFATNDLNYAEPHMQWLIKNKPGDALPHAGMAFILLQQGQVGAAQEQAQIAINSDRAAPEGHMAMGAVLMRKGQPVLAREQFKIALNAPMLSRWLKDRAQQMMNEIN